MTSLASPLHVLDRARGALLRRAVPHVGPWFVSREHHNAIAVLLFSLWRRRTRSLHLVPIAVFAIGASVILSGAIEVPPDALRSSFTGQDLASWRWEIAPTLDSELATRLVVLFAFAQSAHYVVWLRLVPEEARVRPAPRTFRGTWIGLRADLGLVALAVFVVLAALFPAWALVDARAARHAYIAFASFHGHLELVALALLATEGRESALGAKRP